MNVLNKSCFIRLPSELHRLAKLKAYESGETLQSWITNLIEEKLEIADDKRRKKTDSEGND